MNLIPTIISPLLMILSPIIVLAWLNVFYVILWKNKDQNKSLSVFTTLLLYLFSLVPLGLFVGYHLMYKKTKVKDGSDFKYSESARKNGELIMIISIASTLFSLINLI